MKNDKNYNAGLSRRHFLQGISGGTVATILIGNDSGVFSNEAAAMGQFGGAAPKGSKVQFHRARLPILQKADVVVAGGSLAGVAAALYFAQQGRKVVLVEHRNYLGREISAALKPWVDLGKLSGKGEAPEPIASCLKKMTELKAKAVSQLGGYTERGTPLNASERESLKKIADLESAPSPGEIPLWIDAFKVSLEDSLLAAGVVPVYASLPTEAISAEGTIRGVVIGNKSGRQVVLGRLVVDATSTAVVARVAGAEFEPETAEDFRFIRMIEVDAVGPLEQATITVPSELGISANRLTVHKGYRGSGHVLIECPMELKMGKMNMEGMMQREIEARKRSMLTAAYLIQNIPAFSKAELAICAYELDGLQTTRLSSPPPAWAAEFKGLDLTFSDKNYNNVRLPMAGFAGPIKGLWCINEAARLQGTSRSLVRDPVNAALLGTAFAKALLPKLGDGEVSVPQATDYAVPDRLAHDLEVKFQDSPQRGRPYGRVMVPPVQVPVLRETDVLVTGGGTSGATCANAAGREGAKTVLFELCSGLGGTGTVGGVSAHWYGRYWAGFCIRNSNLVDEVHKTINCPTSANKLNGRWNIEAKMFALLKDAEASGVDVFFNATTIAAILQDNEVRGAVAATPYGPVAVLAKVTADTTGDGDVAAFAGAKYFYGAARDHYPTWYNLAQFLEPAKSRWHFMHTVDVTNVDDYTRAILIGRRRGPICHDHGCYIAPRETRHIMGDVVLTVTDILRHRQFPDVINFGAGQMDCHRRMASDWVRIGLLYPILPTEMPYRAVLPKGLDNILVAGKAFSGGHDALYSLRNQPELENLGGALGVAAAYAVRDGVCPRKVDLRKVQKRLTEVGTLLPEMLTRQIKEEPNNEATIKALVKELDGRHFSAWEDVQMAKEGEPGFRKMIPIVEICSSSPALAVPILEEEMAKESGDRQLRLAQALAMFGSRSAAPVLIAAIERAVAAGNAPPRNTPRLGRGQKAAGVPTPPADLMYSLGMTRDPRALAIWEKMAGIMKLEPQDFDAELPWPFFYTDAICYGAELLGDPAAAPVLSKIHSQPTLQNQSAKKGFQIDFNLEKRALTELTLARALASLGKPEGYETLIEYLDDNRANLAEFAHMTLEELTGHNNGKDPRVWRQWLAVARNSLEPVPPFERVDG